MLAVTSPEKPRAARWSLGNVSTGRIEALSDGVFAIVLTLMVFQIRVPDLTDTQAANELWFRLHHQWPEFYSYAISFIVVGTFWVGHHNLFHLVKRSTRVLLWLNLMILMFVAFVPYSVALAGRYPDIRWVEIIYGVHLMIIGGLNYAQWQYVTRWHRLVEDDVDDALIRDVNRRILLTPAVCLLAISASFINVRWSNMIYLLLLVLYVMPNRLDHAFSHSAKPGD